MKRDRRCSACNDKHVNMVTEFCDSCLQLARAIERNPVAAGNILRKYFTKGTAQNEIILLREQLLKIPDNLWEFWQQAYGWIGEDSPPMLPYTEAEMELVRKEYTNFIDQLVGVVSREVEGCRCT